MYVNSIGESIDLLQLYGVQTQMGRYVALVMDNIFTKEELTTITSEKLLKDERYSIIKGKTKPSFFYYNKYSLNKLMFRSRSIKI